MLLTTFCIFYESGVKSFLKILIIAQKASANITLKILGLTYNLVRDLATHSHAK